MSCALRNNKVNLEPTMAKLILVPLTPDVWRQFTMFFKARGADLPLAPPETGVFIQIDGGPLVSGVCIYPTKGPFAFFEHFAVNPEAPPRLLRKAAQLTALALHEYSALTSKVGLVAPGRRMPGLQRVLAQNGFQYSPGTLMVCLPTMSVGAWSEKPPGRPIPPGGQTPRSKQGVRQRARRKVPEK